MQLDVIGAGPGLHRSARRDRCLVPASARRRERAPRPRSRVVRAAGGHPRSGHARRGRHQPSPPGPLHRPGVAPPLPALGGAAPARPRDRAGRPRRPARCAARRARASARPPSTSRRSARARLQVAHLRHPGRPRDPHAIELRVPGLRGAVRRRTPAGPGLVYSGDCGRAEDLDVLARPGDTLLCEVSFGPGPIVPGAEHLDGPAVGDLATPRQGRPRPADPPPDGLRP